MILTYGRFVSHAPWTQTSCDKLVNINTTCLCMLINKMRITFVPCGLWSVVLNVVNLKTCGETRNADSLQTCKKWGNTRKSTSIGSATLSYMLIVRSRNTGRCNYVRAPISYLFITDMLCSVGGKQSALLISTMQVCTHLISLLLWLAINA